MEYFEQQHELLANEKKEDLRLYRSLIETASVGQRRLEGVTWYPVAIRNQETGYGDYLTIDVERTTHKDVTHQLRSGSPASLFSNHDPSNDRLDGTIIYQGADKLKLSLRVDELPEWASNGKLGIDLLFDDNSYDEMFRAIKAAEERLRKREDAQLIEVLAGNKKPSFRNENIFLDHLHLNSSQKKAVQKILLANELAIVHGPPGTGKTTTIVQAVKALIAESNRQVLVVAPSNAAVDLLAEKLADQGLHVLRIGNPARISDTLASLTLDSKMAQHNQMKRIKTLRKQAGAFRDMAHKYKRNFGKSEREQRKALFDEARKIMKEVETTEQYITADIVENTQVVAATLVGAQHHSIRNLTYDTVVIDEAGQALEPACWIPLIKAKRAVLSGDHLQLPPTIKSRTAHNEGFYVTLLEKMLRSHPEAVTLLEEQYRMHMDIMHYSNQYFYEGKLTAHSSIALHTLFEEDQPVSFIDTAGCGFNEQTEDTSISNPEEAAFLLKHLTLFIENLTSAHAELPAIPSIAIIAPYKQQVILLKDQLLQIPLLHKYGDNIAVNTVDSFQGQERDIVYISMVRSNDEGAIGFLSDLRRMNVAMTRARKKLVIVGDSATLAHATFYSGFIAYTQEIGAYQSAWEFMDI